MKKVGLLFAGILLSGVVWFFHTAEASAGEFDRQKQRIGRENTVEKEEAATEDKAFDDTYLWERLADYDLQEIQDGLDALMPGFSVDLEEGLALILQGEFLQAIASFGSSIKEAVFLETTGMKHLFISILVIGIISALFSNFSDIFSGKQISQVGFYFMYLFLMAVLTKAFSQAAEVAALAMENVLLFVKLFVPTLFMAVGASVGSITAVFYYQIMLIIAYLVESFLLHGILPLIYSYVILALLNGIWAEERLSLLLDLLKKGILFAQKLVMGLMTGLGLVQAVIVPALDGLKLSTFKKAVSSIPGIGNAAEGVAELVLGAAILIKNGLGILFLAVLLLLCTLPLLKILMTAVFIKTGAALSGIVSDKRIAGCADRVGEGCFLLLGCLFTAAAMFIIMIGIVACIVR